MSPKRNMNRSCSRSGRDRGAALPLVILMVVLLAVTLSATAVLTQSSATTVRTQAVESSKRSALVAGALQSALRELTPSTGRLLGVDPRVDPAGSCVGQLGIYTDPVTQQTVRVDCVQAPYSGSGSALSSLLLVGDGTDCGSSCIPGQDGGLYINSNSALAFQGILVNVSGAWDAKKVVLNPESPTTASVLQPDPAAGCPATIRNFQFTFSTSGYSAKCDCPSGMDASHCYKRIAGDLQADVTNYVRRTGTGLNTSLPGDVALIPSCGAAARLNATDPTSPWVIKLAGGVVGPTELAALNALTSGKNECIGNGSTKAAPALIVTGVLRFQDSAAGSPMAPMTARSASNTWTIDAASAVVVAGTPVFDAATSVITDCDTGKSGAMLQFAGSSYLQLASGQMFLCPPVPNGIVVVAPTSSSGTGFAWQGDRTQPLVETKFGSAGGEVLKAHGLVYAPAAFININSQDKSTQVKLDGGSVLRALTLTANASAGVLAKGSFYAPKSSPSGQREVQLRFWDQGRQRDLGIVQVVISDRYSGNPAFAYAFKVWRTMW